MAQIWLEGNSSGHELPKSSRETEVAKDFTLQEVVLAALRQSVNVSATSRAKRNWREPHQTVRVPSGLSKMDSRLRKLRIVLTLKAIVVLSKKRCLPRGHKRRGQAKSRFGRLAFRTAELLAKSRRIRSPTIGFQIFRSRHAASNARVARSRHGTGQLICMS